MKNRNRKNRKIRMEIRMEMEILVFFSSSSKVREVRDATTITFSLAFPTLAGL